jgi:hypothetical protein
MSTNLRVKSSRPLIHRIMQLSGEEHARMMEPRILIWD